MAKKTKGNWLRERIAREAASKNKIRAAWMRQKVYGRADAVPPPAAPSQSVRTVSSGFETNRRRH